MNLKTRVTILGLTKTKSLFGDYTVATTVKASNVPSSFRLLKGEETDQYAAWRNTKLVRFYFRAKIDVVHPDRILFAGDHYEVLDVYDVAGEGNLLHVDTRLMNGDETNGS